MQRRDCQHILAAGHFYNPLVRGEGSNGQAHIVAKLINQSHKHSAPHLGTDVYDVLGCDLVTCDSGWNLRRELVHGHVVTPPRAQGTG